MLRESSGLKTEQNNNENGEKDDDVGREESKEGCDIAENEKDVVVVEPSVSSGALKKKRGIGLFSQDVLEHSKGRKRMKVIPASGGSDAMKPSYRTRSKRRVSLEAKTRKLRSRK